MGTTSRLVLPYPAAGAANNVPADIQALADDLDLKLARSGTYAARPGGTIRDGSRYYCTDLGIELVGNGGVWVQLQPKMSVGLRTDRPAIGTVIAGSHYYCTDTGVEYISDGSAWRRDHDPCGTFTLCPFDTPPSGHVVANGQALSTSNVIYADLYALYGTTWGSGAGTFKVPDLRDRVPYGRPTMGALTRSETAYISDVLGDAGTIYPANPGGGNHRVFAVAIAIRI